VAISPADVSAVLVTRGDVDMAPVLDSLPFDEVVVWDNSQRPEDFQCYGRFAGIAETTRPFIYVQDDDIVVPVQALLDAYEPAKGSILANKKPDEEWRFLGVGSLFPRELADCFGPYAALYGMDQDFYRAADVVFAYQHGYESVWVGYEELEWSRAPNRMYLQPGHYEVRERLRARTLALPSSAP
jgi:hypothetical protein